MCFLPALAAIGTALSGAFTSAAGAITGGAAAAGATGAAAGGITFGQIASLAGTAASVGGTLAAGAAEAQAGRMNAQLAERQARVEAMLAGVEDQRTRERMRLALATQRAQLAGRGVSLDSPTAILLGQTAAREASVASQDVRSRGVAATAGLSAEARAYRGRATGAVLGGRLSAATSLLTAAPKLWPGLADTRVFP